MTWSGTPRPPAPGPAPGVGQPELGVREASHTNDSVFAASLTEPGIQADLCVHVVVRAPGLLDDRDIRGDRPEVLDQKPVERRREVHPGSAHKSPHRPTPESSHAGELCSATTAVTAGTTSRSAHRLGNPRLCRPADVVPPHDAPPPLPTPSRLAPAAAHAA